MNQVCWEWGLPRPNAMALSTAAQAACSGSRTDS